MSCCPGAARSAARWGARNSRCGSGGKLGNKVATVNEIEGMRVSMTADVALGAGITPGVGPNATSTFRG